MKDHNWCLLSFHLVGLSYQRIGKGYRYRGYGDRGIGLGYDIFILFLLRRNAFALTAPNQSDLSKIAEGVRRTDFVMLAWFFRQAVGPLYSNEVKFCLSGDS